MPDTLTPGARAALELRLQEARRDLAEVIERQNAAAGQADVFRALADEASGARRVSRNASAIKYRLRAVGLASEVRDLQGRVVMLEGMLAGKACSDQVAPEVTPAMCAGQDETMNFVGVAA